MLAAHQLHQVAIPDDVFANLKRDFRRSINSTRRSFCIRSVVDLIDVLWKRDLIRPSNHRLVLEDLVNAVSRQEQELIADYICQLATNDQPNSNGNQYGK